VLGPSERILLVPRLFRERHLTSLARQGRVSQSCAAGRRKPERAEGAQLAPRAFAKTLPDAPTLDALPSPLLPDLARFVRRRVGRNRLPARRFLSWDHPFPAPRLLAKTLAVEANDAKTSSSALLRYK
jgi:hypothetical protein